MYIYSLKAGYKCLLETLYNHAGLNNKYLAVTKI